MINPLFSIICPLYNKASYISETIDSVLSQTNQDWELIIIENGSVDGSIECVKKFVDDRIKLIISSKRGPGSARNHGIMNALGEWILFLDADDLINPDYLANQLNFANRNPEADIIVGKWVQFNDGSNAEYIKLPPGYPIVNRVLVDSAIAFTPWAPNAAIVRRAILQGDYLWPEHMDKLLAEDTPFWFKLVDRLPRSYDDW
jgi:glycosyltransferase involved in cell wall biosynthesis